MGKFWVKLFVMFCEGPILGPISAKFTPTNSSIVSKVSIWFQPLWN